MLDVGCGAGLFTIALAGARTHPVGVDVAAEPLRRARRDHPELELQLYAGGRLPFADAEFDVAWVGEVLEHVADGLELLDEVRRVLAPGGRLLISTPDHPRRLVWRLALDRRAFERHFDPRSDHVRFFTARTLVLLLEEASFSPIDMARRGGTLLVRAER